MCYASVYGDLFGFAEDGELAITFCSLATGLLGQTALGAKKEPACCEVSVQSNLPDNTAVPVTVKPCAA